MNLAKPLDSFRLVRTRSIEETQSAIAKVYARPSIEFGRGTKIINTCVNVCTLRNVKVGYVSYGADLRLEFPDVDAFLQLVPLRGKAEIFVNKNAAASLTPETSAAVSPNTGYTAKYDIDYEFLVLQIDKQALTQHLAARIGATINKPLWFHVQPGATSPHTGLLLDYLRSLVRTLSTAAQNTPFPDWWLGQTEQFLMTLALCCNRHNYSHFFDDEAPNAALSQVRRAEEYIEENWRQSIGLEDLAAVTGVSAFSLFRAFRKYRGYSPLNYLAQIRSRRAGTLC